MNCEPCDRALAVLHHEYTSGCRGCQARSLSRAPDFIRDRYLETLAPGDRASMLDAARAEFVREREQARAVA